MILNTGNRTDIPAFFSDWFFNRIQEGFVCVRNPYFPHQVTKYILDPQVIDIICFCTKNPKPMLSRLDLIKDYKQFWFVTITPYNQTIEHLLFLKIHFRDMYRFQCYIFFQFLQIFDKDRFDLFDLLLELL